MKPSAGSQEFRRKLRDDFEKDFNRVVNNKSNYQWLFIGILAILIVLFMVFFLGIHSGLPFCDTGAYSRENCTPCPNNGICSNGRFEGCDPEFKVRGNLCVPQEERMVLIGKMYRRAVQLLSEHRGKQECEGTQNYFVSISSLQQIIEKEYQSDEDFDSSYRRMVSQLTENSNPDVQLEGYERIMSTTPSYTVACAVIVFWRSRKILVTLFGLFLIFAAYLVYAANKELQRRSLAAKIYKDAEAEVQVAEGRLLPEPRLKRRAIQKWNMSLAEVDSIWPLVIAEARYRQRVDFLSRMVNGNDERAWWIEQ